MLCARCSRQVWLCRDCDRGQRYSEEEGRAASRRESLKRAGAAYQRGRRGRRLHAARAQRYRERKRATAAKFSDQKVTHHAVTQGEGRGTSLGTHTAEGRAAKPLKEPHARHEETARPARRCCRCGRLVSALTVPAHALRWASVRVLRWASSCEQYVMPIAA